MRALFTAAVVVAAAATLTSCTYDAGTVDESVKAPAPSHVSETPSVTQPPGIAPGEPNPSGRKPPAGTTPSAPVSMGPNGPVVPAGVTQVPAGQVDASALPAYYDNPAAVWVYDDGYSLEMFAAASSGCAEEEAVVVDQSADSVRVTLRPLANQPGGRPDSRPCTAVMTPRPVTVRLREPLGDRTVQLGIGR